MEKQRLTNSFVEKLKPRDRYFDIYDTDVTGLHVRVETTGARAYRLRYTLADGTRRCIRIGGADVLTADNARQIAKDHWADARRGTDPLARKHRPQEPTLESFLTKVYEPRATHRTAAETIERVKYAFPDLLEKRLSDIRPMWIENWRKARLAEGIAKSTTNRDIDCLRGVLSRAVDWEYLAEHPLKRVKRFKLDTGGKPRYLTADEEQRLYNALEEREEKARARRDRFNEWRQGRSHKTFDDLRAAHFTDHLKPMTILALNTGLRRGEIFNLEWRDLDIDGEGPHVTIQGDSAKSGRTRHVPLNRLALEVMVKWREQTGGEGLVFKSPKTGGRFDHIRRSWSELTKLAKLENFRFHDCRHHFASMLVQRGVDLNTVRELLGHADIKMTLRYGHLAPGNAARAVALLEPVPHVERKAGGQ